MDTRILPFINPATNECFGQLTMTTPTEITQASQEMNIAAKIWSQKPIEERIRILQKFQQVMIDSLDEITDVLNQDCGKSRQDALIEVFVTLDMLKQYCKHAPRWLRGEKVSRGLYFFKNCFVEHRPYGVVAVIAPWNYPLALSMPPTLAALLTGNTVLLKPSEVTAASGLLMERLFQRVPELAPFVRVLHGDGVVGAAMVNTNPDYIFLTGSTPTGRKVMQAAADSLTPVACELGGKDAMIVLADADLPGAARWGVWGAFFNTGQTCMSVERVYVVEEVYDRFVELAVEEARKLKMGYTRDIDSPFYLGPITDPRQVNIIRDHLEDALAKGARILTGGAIRNMFVEPTVLVDVDHDMHVMQDETFGPLMPIVKVKDAAEAIRLANNSNFGLGASIWSADLKRARAVAEQIEAASIIINDTIAQFAVPMLPFGGIKQSGYGRIHGKEGLMQFTRPYAYVVGTPPPSWDIGTILREPGHYQESAALVRVAFGATAQQRLQGLVQALPKIKSHGKTGIPTRVALPGAILGLALTWRLLGSRKKP